MKKKKILIVEDDSILLQLLTDKFVNKNFNVISASDGKQGLEVALKEHPDFILLDIILPTMDGVSVLNKLKKDKWGQNVPVIILTNLSDSRKVIEATKLGVHDYLVKVDWTLEDVVKKVEEIMVSYKVIKL